MTEQKTNKQQKQQQQKKKQQQGFIFLCKTVRVGRVRRLQQSTALLAAMLSFPPV